MALVEIMKEFETNTRWIDKNYEELKAQYPNEWVAVLNQSVVDHSKNLASLVKTLKHRYLDDYTQIAVEYISTKKVHLILRNE